VSSFPVHSIETAPSRARARLEAAQAAFGFVPNLLGMLAESPAALEAYQGIAGAFQRATLSPAEQNVVLLAVSVANSCHYCVAAHSVISAGAGVPGEAIEAIRNGQPIQDSRLEAVRRFTTAVVRERGWSKEALDQFLNAGYTRAQALEVLVGVAQKTLSNYANHLAETPLDPAFSAEAWSPAVGRAS
jgi:AhpD family alkylhydroperoxidase